GSQIRVDAGVAAGSIVPAFYDPLIAKLVVGGSSRDAAVRRMLRSVDVFEVRGIHSTLPFHRVLLSDRDFIKGNLWTTMVDDLRLVARIRSRGPWEQRIAEIAAAVAASGRLVSGPTVDLLRSKASAWSTAGRRQLLAGGDHAVPPRRRWSPPPRRGRAGTGRHPDSCRRGRVPWEGSPRRRRDRGPPGSEMAPRPARRPDRLDRPC